MLSMAETTQVFVVRDLLVVSSVITMVIFRGSVMRTEKVVEIRAIRTNFLQLLHQIELHLNGILLVLAEKQTAYRISIGAKSKRVHQMLSPV